MLFELIIFLVTLSLRAFNLFGYPVYLGDEGVYSFQGWWLVNFKKLAPYTYWYDHPPFGWLMIGLWQKFIGGPFAFGFSLHASRIFMVILASLGGMFLFSLMKELTKSKFLSLATCLVYAFSPLTVYYQRLVLLDNLETFWLILSLLCLFKARKRALFYLLSGCLYGLAFLSKEIAIVFLPVLSLMVLRESSGQNKNHSRLLWFTSAFFLVSLFPLLAFLKKELLPVTGQVSLFNALWFQLTRGKNENETFLVNLVKWLQTDYLFLFTGIWALIVNLVNWKNKRGFLFSLLGISYILFLVRGGLVLSFYLIPLLVVLVINIGLGLKALFSTLHVPVIFRQLLLILLTGFYLQFAFKGSWYFFTHKTTNNQEQAVSYIKANLPSSATVAVDDFAFLDVRLPGNASEPAFPKAEWYSKVENDPEIRQTKLNDNWRSLDYLMINKYILSGITTDQMPFLKTVLDNSSLVKKLSRDDSRTDS